MKQLSRVLIALFIMLVFSGHGGYANDTELTPAQQEAVKKAVEQYLQEKVGAPPPAAAAGAPPSVGGVTGGGKRLQELAVPRTPGEKYGSTMQGSGGLIYARPFVASPKAIVGGYTSIFYFNRTNDGTASFFDGLRTVPFIYADVSDRVKFATEIEFEHTGRHPLEGTEPNTMEIGIEFMALDYLITEPFNLRGGVILLPLGKFNLLH
ncbi:MAG: hypothetical protein D6704_01875, partial [Nitrospirae bacterium]